MDEIRPPYSAPTYTAASKINALSGGSCIAKAIGTNMATALIGPSPGRTPTIVPINPPIAAINRLIPENATPIPNAKCSQTPLIVHLLKDLRAIQHPSLYQIIKTSTQTSQHHQQLLSTTWHQTACRQR